MITNQIMAKLQGSTRQGAPLRRGRLPLGSGWAGAALAAPKSQGRGRHYATLRCRHISLRSFAFAVRLPSKSPPPPLRAEIGHIAGCALRLGSLSTAKEPAPALRLQPALCPGTWACSLSPLPSLEGAPACPCSVAPPAWCCVFTFVNCLLL